MTQDSQELGDVAGNSPNHPQSTGELWTKIPLEQIRPGDRFNTVRRMAGQIQIDLGCRAVRIIREGERIWWVMDEFGPVAPENVVSVWRANTVPEDRSFWRAWPVSSRLEAGFEPAD